MCIYIYTYIYIYRERERESARERKRKRAGFEAQVGAEGHGKGVERVLRVGTSRHLFRCWALGVDTNHADGSCHKAVGYLRPSQGAVGYLRQPQGACQRGRSR